MRLLLFTLGIYVALLSIGTRAEAQNYQWCAMLSMGDQAVNCSFVGTEQCMATVRGIGGFCTPNNTFPPTQFPRPIARRGRTSLR
jgi:Protein of unknown function (DUF3551)